MEMVYFVGLVILGVIFVIFGTQIKSLADKALDNSNDLTFDIIDSIVTRMIEEGQRFAEKTPSNLDDESLNTIKKWYDDLTEEHKQAVKEVLLTPDTE